MTAAYSHTGTRKCYVAHMDLMMPILIGAFLPWVSGCASTRTGAECPEARQPLATPTAPSAAPSGSLAGSVPAPPEVVSTNNPGAGAAPAGGGADRVPGASVLGTGAALPELKLQLAGMHIGGGPNDEASKRPFIHAIERSFESLRACYTKAEDPMHGGTFGVDLRIAGKGGTPEVQQVRTALRGEGFRECLTSTFRAIQFSPPPKGPTVVSVSVRFLLGS